MKKINTIETTSEIVSYMEKNDLTLKLYSNYELGGSYIDPCSVYYHDNSGWHYYYRNRLDRVSEIYVLSTDEILTILFENRMQINDRYWDRKYYIFPRNYTDHLTGKIKTA